mgnify:CR=1 FL=1
MNNHDYYKPDASAHDDSPRLRALFEAELDGGQLAERRAFERRLADLATHIANPTRKP